MLLREPIQPLAFYLRINKSLLSSQMSCADPKRGMGRFIESINFPTIRTPISKKNKLIVTVYDTKSSRTSLIVLYNKLMCVELSLRGN